MFWITTATAIVCSLTFTFSEVVAAPLVVLFSVILAAVLITIIVYGRGYQRAFCIGAIVPFSILLFMLGFGGVLLFLQDFSFSRINFLAFRVIVVMFWVLGLLIGVVCMGVRRLVEKRHDRA